MLGKYLGRPRRDRTHRGAWIGVHSRSYNGLVGDECREVAPRERPRADVSWGVWIVFKLSAQPQGQ